MSLIALISVHQCDLCPKVAVMKTDAEEADFQDRWHNGWSKDFCPDCRDSGDAVLAIADEARQQRAIDAVIRKRTLSKEL